MPDKRPQTVARPYAMLSAEEIDAIHPEFLRLETETSELFDKFIKRRGVDWDSPPVRGIVRDKKLYKSYEEKIWNLASAASRIEASAEILKMVCLSIHISIQLRQVYEGRSDAKNYRTKKFVVQQQNAMFRTLRVAIASPASGEPSLLLAVGSPDGYGRYVLESRITKKRSHTSNSIIDLLPLKLIKDVPRKEGVVERRKQEEGGEGQKSPKPKKKKPLDTSSD